MSDVLQKIAAATDLRVAACAAQEPLVVLQRRAEATPPPRPFAAAFALGTSGRALRVIAEIKRASPSQGAIALDMDPLQVAADYLAAGATALSVLTEPDYFGGSPEILCAVRQALPEALLLMKDFLLSPYQVWQARACGADACLLMASLLPPEPLQAMASLALDLGLTPLIEVHSQQELSAILPLLASLPAGQILLGINNRNLKTLQVDLRTTAELLTGIPAPLRRQLPVICESGLRQHSDLIQMQALGCQGFLVGTALMRTGQPGAALRQLLQGEAAQIGSGLSTVSAAPASPVIMATGTAQKTAKTTTKTTARPVQPFSPRPWLKICGLTRAEDVQQVLRGGADALGFVLYASSPRALDPTAAETLFARCGLLTLPAEAKLARVGVFVNAAPAEVLALARRLRLSHLQLHGDEDLAYIQALQALMTPAEARGLQLIKALHLQRGSDLQAATGWPAEIQLLVDAAPAPGSTARGGLGRPANWALAAPLARQRPVILAGGLQPGNLASAWARVGPWGLDLASGVESAPGHKDPDKLQALFAAHQSLKTEPHNKPESQERED